MKKFAVMALSCALMITAAGCGDSAADSKSEGTVFEAVDEDKAGESEALEDKAKEESEDRKASDSDKETKDNEASDAAEVKTEDKESTDAGAEENKDKESSDEGETAGTDAASLFEEFKQGSVRAKYTGAGDRTSYLDTSAVLEKGKSYNMAEIVTSLADADGSFYAPALPEIQYSEIDCGGDGEPELLADAPFGDEFHLLMILKEIDGELVICFDQDSWSRSYVEVKPDGTIEGEGSGGAAVHVVDRAFVDAKGEYKFYYGVEETLTMYGEYYVYTGKDDYTTITADGLDPEHVGVRDYYFEADYDSRTHYYEYFMIDDNYEDVTTEADYDDSNELKKKFTEAGVKTYTRSEMEQMLKDRAAEIGYPGV